MKTISSYSLNLVCESYIGVLACSHREATVGPYNDEVSVSWATTTTTTTTNARVIHSKRLPSQRSSIIALPDSYLLLLIVIEYEIKYHLIENTTRRFSLRA